MTRFTPNPQLLQRREQLWKLLGEKNQHTHFIECTRIELWQDADIIHERWLFTTNDGNQVPALFLRPSNATSPTPAVLYCHAHGNRYDIGCSELTSGRKALRSAYAMPLTTLGFSVLCLEMPCFGERQHLCESATAKACQWQGETLFGWMLGELLAGVTYLCSRNDIESERIAAMGISMGGTHAWWLAALDERVSSVVSLCCFADLAALIETGQHDGHGHYMTVPGLLRSHSTAKIASLTSPRAQFFGVGLQDWSTPANAFRQVRTELETLYKEVDALHQLEFCVAPDSGHVETADMRAGVLDFLSRHL